MMLTLLAVRIGPLYVGNALACKAVPGNKERQTNGSALQQQGQYNTAHDSISKRMYSRLLIGLVDRLAAQLYLRGCTRRYHYTTLLLPQGQLCAYLKIIIPKTEDKINSGAFYFCINGHVYINLKANKFQKQHTYPPLKEITASLDFATGSFRNIFYIGYENKPVPLYTKKDGFLEEDIPLATNSPESTSA